MTAHTDGTAEQAVVAPKGSDIDLTGDENSATESLEALLTTLERFWPDSSATVATRGARAIGPGPQFVAIPRARHPRLLIPSESRRASAVAMRRYSSALSIREAALRWAVSLGIRAGGPRLVGDPIRVLATPGTESLDDYLSTVIGERVTFSISVGSRRVNRKPVLQVFGGGGQSLAFAKIGDSSAAAEHVTAEGRALERLSQRTMRDLDVPRLLHLGEWNHMTVLVMSPMHTGPFQRPWRRHHPPATQMRALTAAFDEGQRTLDDTDWWRRTRAVIERLKGSEDGRAYEALASRVLELAAGRSWTIGAWHGDWTSWNMAWRRDVLQVWDWERFETGVPAGLDLYHFVVNDMVQRKGLDVATIHAALVEVGGRPDDQRARASVLAGVYLLTVAGRYLDAAHGERGDAIRDRASTTLEALIRWLD